MQGDKRRWCTWRKERRAKKTEGSGRGGRHPGTRGGVPTPPNNTRENNSHLMLPEAICNSKSQSQIEQILQGAQREARYHIAGYQFHIGGKAFADRKPNLRSAENEFQNEKSISDRKIHLRSKTQSQIASHRSQTGEIPSQIEKSISDRTNPTRRQKGGPISNRGNPISNRKNPISDRKPNLRSRRTNFKTRNPSQIEKSISDRKPQKYAPPPEKNFFLPPLFLIGKFSSTPNIPTHQILEENFSIFPSRKIFRRLRLRLRWRWRLTCM